MNPRFAVFAAFLMGAVAYQTGPPAGARKTKAGAQTQPTHSTAGAYGENQPAVQDEPLAAICEFVAPQPVARSEAQANANCLPASHPIDFLIATVPDPQNSHYPFMFDAFVESIRLALQDSGYMLDRFRLPWEANSGPLDTDWQKRIEHRTWQAKEQANPGILLFRGEPHEKRESLLGVLLIGEDPIRGINKEQFGKALSLIAKFRRPDDPKTVSVLGPAFSGSIPSLAIAMRNGEDAEVKYRVITGSATAKDNAAALSGYMGDRATYESAIVNDDVATRSFFEYLENLPHPVGLKKIAILAESGSEFSIQFVKHTPTGVSTLESPLILEYPMEISRLRNAYANDPELSALSSANASKAPPQGLQISLKDAEGTKDSIPSFSPELTPVSQEAALLNTLATISREKIEYVGIVASDILDAIFLGHLLQQHCPDVRLFVGESNLIYAHTDQNYSFEGMLMVTRYPLFTENQWWTNLRGRRQRRQFSSGAAEGVYNAGLLFLNPLLHRDNPTPLVEYATPQPDGKSIVLEPALWLTVVGREGIWPVTTLPSLEGSKHPLSQDPLQRPALTESSRGWKLLFWLMTLFCGLFAAGVIVCNLGPDRSRKIRQGWLSVLYVGTDKHYPTTVQVCLSAALGVLAIAYGFIAAVQMSFFGLHGGYFAPIALACGLIPAVLLAAVAQCWLPAKAAGSGWIAAAVAAMSLAASALFSERMCVHPLPLPFVYRTVHVGNGVDPVVPAVLLAIALLWYVWVQLYRIHLCRARAVDLPSFPDDVYLSAVAHVKDEMLKALPGWLFGKWSWTVAAVLGLGIWLLKPMRSIETFPFEWPYAAGLCLLFAGLWLGCVRFFYIWWNLRKILRMIERHPLREAFKRLPPELSPTTVWRWQGSRTYLTLAHSIERLRGLPALGMSQRLADGRDFQTHFGDLEKDVRKLIAADALGTVLEKELKTVGSEVVAFSDYLLKYVLTSYWETGNAADVPQAMATAAGVSGAAQISPPPAVSKSTALAAEEYVALRFVALFRYVTLHLKNLLEFGAGALILTLVSLNSYPFEPRHLIVTSISVCFFAGAAAFAGALLQMHKNPIMSYSGDGKLPALNMNLLHVLSFGALPLITVLGSQFPSIGGFLFAWVKPALENLR